MKRLLACAIASAFLLVTAVSVAGVEYPGWVQAPWIAPMGKAVKDTCRTFAYRDTIDIDALGFKYVYLWTVECPPSDGDVGVWVTWVPAFNAAQGDSDLIRQNTAYTWDVPISMLYLHACAGDTLVRYTVRLHGEPK